MDGWMDGWIADDTGHVCRRVVVVDGVVVFGVVVCEVDVSECAVDGRRTR